MARCHDGQVDCMDIINIQNELLTSLVKHYTTQWESIALVSFNIHVYLPQ